MDFEEDVAEDGGIENDGDEFEGNCSPESEEGRSVENDGGDEFEGNLENEGGDEGGSVENEGGEIESPENEGGDQFEETWDDPQNIAKNFAENRSVLPVVSSFNLVFDIFGPGVLDTAPSGRYLADEYIAKYTRPGERIFVYIGLAVGSIKHLYHTGIIGNASVSGRQLNSLNAIRNFAELRTFLDDVYFWRVAKSGTSSSIQNIRAKHDGVGRIGINI